MCLAAADARALVDVDHGGRLVSLAVAGRELLTTAAWERPAAIPANGSFLMAPWVGELSEGRIEFRGEVAHLPRNVGRHAVHGVVADGAWTLESETPTALTLVRGLTPSWPFGGRVRQEVSLDSGGITQVASVSAGARAMPASLGWHPWFRCDRPAETRVCVRARARLDLNDEGIPTGRIVALAPDLDLSEAPAVGGRRLDVVYLGARSPAEIVAPGLRLTIAYDPAISVIVVHTTATSVCVEPWSAWPDAIRMAALGLPSGVVELEQGETMTRWTRWTWALSPDR